MDTEANYKLKGSADQLWLHEVGAIGKVNVGFDRSDVSESAYTKPLPNSLTLLPYEPKIVPYPNPILFGIQVSEDWPTEALRFSVKGAPSGMKVKGQGIFWQPRWQLNYHQASNTGANNSTKYKGENWSPNYVPRHNRNPPTIRAKLNDTMNWD